MTLVNAETGEIKVFTEAEAQAVTDRLRDAAGEWAAAVDDLKVAIAEAYEGRVWLAFGIASWSDYCNERVPELAHVRLPVEMRQAVVGYLTSEAQMSTRAIGAAIGVSEGTVRNDQAAGAQNYAPADDGVSCGGCGNFLSDCVCDDAEIVPPPPRTTRGVDGKSYTAPRQRVIGPDDALAMRKSDIAKRIERLQSVWRDLSSETRSDFDKGHLAELRVLARELIRFVEQNR
jgi:hypothetical protein